MNTATKNPISEAQLNANRANAQSSTGPRSTTGKAAIALNAVKAGLTGATVVLPNEDANKYRAYIAEYEAEFQPAGVQERDLVQSLADLRWRLNRIPALEAALDSHARAKFFEKFSECAEQEREFRLDVDVYNENAKKLHNIHLHEARLARRYEKELVVLRALQQERKAKEAKAAQAAAEAKSQPTAPAQTTTAAAAAGSSENGFEFANRSAAQADSSASATETPEGTAKQAA
jgi:hypothetical protein